MKENTKNTLHLDCFPNNFDSHSSCGFWSVRGGFVGGTVAMVFLRIGSVRFSFETVSGLLIFTVGNWLGGWFKELPELLCDKSSS